MSWPQTSDSKSFAQFILKDPFSLIFQVKQNLIQCCLFLPFCLNVHLLGSWGKGWFSNSCLEAVNEFDLEKNWKPVGCTTSSNLLRKIYLLTVSSDACILICSCPGEALSSSTYSFSKHSLHYVSNETLSLSRAKSRDIYYSFRIFPFKLASLDHLLRSSTLKLSEFCSSQPLGVSSPLLHIFCQCLLLHSNLCQGTALPHPRDCVWPLTSSIYWFITETP